MSFSQEVKSELCRADYARYGDALALAYGVLLYSNTFSRDGIKIVTGSEEFAALVPKLFKKTFSMEFDAVSPPKKGGKRILEITDREKMHRILDAFGYEPDALVAHHINLGLLEDDSTRECFVRGAFLAGGSVTSPEKHYHLEFVCDHYYVSREITALFIDMGFEPGTVTRSGHYITYFKNSAVIEDILTTIGAPISAMSIMNAKIEKDMMNAVNRKVNCDTANVLKTVLASEEQINAIRRLRDSGVFDTLPEKLKEAARLREENPELSLTDLAAAAEPPLTKSGLNHRMRKLMSLAEELKQTGRNP